MRHHLTLLIVAGMLTACASSGMKSSSTGRDQNRITADEIATVHASTAYDLVQVLRPQMLRVSGARSINGTDVGSTTIVVYLDRARMGGPEILRSIPAGDVHEIEFLDPSRATAQLGTGHLFGAIVVTTKNARGS